MSWSARRQIEGMERSVQLGCSVTGEAGVVICCQPVFEKYEIAVELSRLLWLQRLNIEVKGW